MPSKRIPETDHGIQGEWIVDQYDQMQRHLRDKGWIETAGILRCNIISGAALEIGPGPGYLGLEWLRQTNGTTLTGLDISPDMLALARHNAEVYGFTGRAEYHQGNCDRLPFQDQKFDAVFSNGSLHEWADPQAAFEEIWRVLKHGGRYFLSDLRRDMNPLIRGFLWWGTIPTKMRPGLISSINAAYTVSELTDLARSCPLQAGTVTGTRVGLILTGIKTGG